MPTSSAPPPLVLGQVELGEHRLSPGVAAHHPDEADARGSEILYGRRTDASGADMGKVGIEQRLLTRAADFLQNDMARVPVELPVAEDH